MIRYFFIILFILLTGSASYLGFLFAPTGLSDEKIRFVIPLETKQEDIIERLKQENFIRSKLLFQFIAPFAQSGGTIEPGSYMLSHRMHVLAIADTLLKHPYQKWIVLVPGLRMEQIGERLHKKFGWNDDTLKEFLSHAKEGYMFPDTYLLNVDFNGQEVAQRLIANFNEKFDAKLQEDLLSQNVRIDTAVKIASLIERESESDEDKAIIAGVIWNRLDKDMRLQIDAVNEYVLGKPDKWWPTVTRKDPRIESAYNTYLHKGLPPGPICNPSLASLRAAVYPAKTDCFFYLHDRNKGIHCAVTYEQHLENIQTYLR